MAVSNVVLSNAHMRSFAILILSLAWVSCQCSAAFDLLGRYPTELTVGDTAPERARSWEFSTNDLFGLTGFELIAGENLQLEVGAADLGIGHCRDGAVWAVVIPHAGGRISSPSLAAPETIRHVWLRFHPREIARLFPPETIIADGNPALEFEMLAIARAKLTGSWHAGPNVMIPEPKDVTVDVDTEGPHRRFFAVDREAGTARYVAAFADRPVRPPPPMSAALAARGFDQLWEAFDREYALFVLRPEVDWVAMREQYRPRALAAPSSYAFANTCADMLRPLRDLHIWMDVAGTPIPVFNRDRQANANPVAIRKLLSGLKSAGPRVQWFKTDDQIGYLVVHQWDDAAIPRQVDEVLEQMRDTRGLIVDVRLNGGGSEPQARDVAGRFLETEFLYAYSQYRNGPHHTNLTGKIARTVAPRGPWRYDRPVIVLIGQKCMSSNESFIAMMSGAPQVTTMGDHTCGSSGNPRMLRLPLDITVSLPRWIDLLPDGQPLDERGFQPQVHFEPPAGAFEGDRDDLLVAAFDRLRQVPLPDQPIQGPPLPPATAAAEPPPSDPFRLNLAEAMQEEAKDPERPKVIGLWPAEGATNVEPVTELRLRFDRPMDPLSSKLDWDVGGFLTAEYPRYDADRQEFIVPVRLPPGTEQEIVINKIMPGFKPAEARALFCREGFQTTDHRLAGVQVWRFRTKSVAHPAQAAPPGVVSLSPATGSQVPLLCFAEIQFDQSMLPPAQALPYSDLTAPPWDRGGLIGHLGFDAAERRFRLPLLLPPNKRVRFALAGFRSVQGVAAEPVCFEYQTGSNAYSEEFAMARKRAGEDPRLEAVLFGLQQQRTQLTSLVERVQTLMVARQRDAYTSFRTTAAEFKWRRPNLFVAEAAGPMSSCRAFTVGCDGRQVWWHYAARDRETLTLCLVDEVPRKNLSIADPFGLAERPVKEAIQDLGLSLADHPRAGDQTTSVVESWAVAMIGDTMTQGSLTRWRIDPQTQRLLDVDSIGDGYEFRSRFLYDAVNEPLPDSAFAPPADPGLRRETPEALDADYPSRFLNVRDGADGRMSVRWGKEGPKGRSSSGLN